MNLSDKAYSCSTDINKKNRFKKFLKMLCLFFLSTALFLPLFYMIYLFKQFDKINTKPICKSDEALGIKPDQQYCHSKNNIINIALLGTDRRTRNEFGRSDMIIIATLDFKHKDLKLSSIMRDSYVKIDRHGHNKITHAYVYGGPELAINTINKNFNLNIRDYISVDFFNVKKLIDIVGGVSIDVNQSELSSINRNMAELSHIEKSKYKKIEKPGIQKLDGNQALAYARIRDVGNGDYERTLRQRKILLQLFTELSYIDPYEYRYIVTKAFPLIETSISKKDILKYGSMLLYENINDFKQARFPTNNNFLEKKIHGVDFIVPDMDKTTTQMHQFIFEDICP